MSNETTTSGIDTDTRCSVRVGSDQYRARIVKVTDATITAVFGNLTVDEDEPMTFRRNKYGRWTHKGSYRLVLGVCETRLDADF
jgi:hypothetical protein